MLSGGTETMLSRLSAFFLFIVLLSAGIASADPMKQTEDLSGSFVIPYGDGDPAAGSFTFSYRYPCIDDSEPDANAVNSFYRDLVETDETNMVFFADGYAELGISVIKDISYRVTCNNDDYFCALMIQHLTIGDSDRLIWEGHVFSRKSGALGTTVDLPRLLNLLDEAEQDEYLLERQSEKASEVVIEMMLNMIDANPERIPYYYDTITYEYLLDTVFPENDFYLDENGDPVFFVNPGVIADESLGYLLFPIPLADIEEEL